MINLREYMNSDTVMLSATDKMVLISIFSSPTPEMAYEATSGSENVVSSRNKLHSFGFIKVSQNQTIVTNSGKRALLANNLIDATDHITDEGNSFVEVLPDKKKIFSECMQFLQKLF